MVWEDEEEEDMVDSSACSCRTISHISAHFLPAAGTDAVSVQLKVHESIEHPYYTWLIVAQATCERTAFCSKLSGLTYIQLLETASSVGLT